MTAEAQRSKNIFRLNGGLNTELNEINFPDGYTTDEANYEILIDGSRRRRKGLADESGASAAHTVSTFNAGELSQTYLWENVGGDPDKSLMVYRKGITLYLADADETISDGWYSESITLTNYYTDNGTAALMRAQPCTFSVGNGNLFVANPYLQTIYITYDASGDAFTVVPIPIYIRDYTTIDEGIDLQFEPTSLSADHEYNLRNRGWKKLDYGAYFSAVAKYPSLASLWYRAYKRVDTTTGVEPTDGTMTFDSARLDAEVFSNTSAPKGSLFLNPYDTTAGYGGEDLSGQTNISTWSHVDNGSTWTVTINTADNHGLANPSDTVTISGNTFRMIVSGESPLTEEASLDGTYTSTYVDADTFTITYTEPTGYGSIDTRYVSKGYIDSNGGLSRSSGTDHGDGPKAVEFHHGRVFYSGFTNTEFNDYLFFSQIADNADKYGKCYQEADPTGKDFNALVATDGGYMIIEGMGGVTNMLSVRNALLVFTNKGVWEVSGGRQGVFTADGYQVRKITDNPSIGAMAPIAIEDSAVYTGPGGIYRISPNQYTGILEAVSLSEFTIQTFWNQIPDAEQKRVQTAYDSALKRVYFMYGPNGTTNFIDTMLIYDVRNQAWFKYTFDTPSNNGLLTGFSIGNADDTSDNKKMKFLYEASTTSVQVADFDQTSFDDWDGTNGPLPYMYTSWDNIGDYQARRQAPIITVYQKRTETGYTESGGEYTAVNDSSTLLSGYWDWTSDATNEATTNKITATQEVYRHVRDFTPSATTDLDGYPVVVTRNKLRGRGRVLQLKFEGATDKDSHIMGFTINYKVSRRK